MQPSVVTVGRIHGGSAANAIPGEVELGGTVRSYSADSRSSTYSVPRIPIVATDVVMR